MNFLCPNCNSNTHLSKHSLGKKFTDGPYKLVNFEIQCSECFMDIPSNLSENIEKINLDKCRKLWNDVYKPAHTLEAAKCSKCFRYYWDI